MKKLKIITTVLVIGFLLVSCSAKKPPSDSPEETSETSETTAITTTETTATVSETTAETTEDILFSERDYPRTAEEAVDLYMITKEANFYSRGKRFFYEYHILDEKRDGDNVTLMVYSISSWIDSNFKECSGGAGVTGINFTIKDDIWEYKDRFIEDHIDIEEKYGNYPHAEMKRKIYADIAQYLKENYTDEIRLANTIRNISYATSDGDAEYKDKWFLDVYYNEFHYDNKTIKLEEDKINAFINDSDKFGFTIWESSYPPSPLDNWHNWRMKIIYLDGTEKIIECKYFNPVTWNAMYDVFDELTGLENVLG